MLWPSSLVLDLLVDSVSERGVQFVYDLLETFKGELLVFLCYYEVRLLALHRCLDAFVYFGVDFQDLC